MTKILKKMRCAVLSAAAAALLAAVVSADKPEASVAFERTAHDFGIIAEDGAPAVTEFVFTNTGDGPLVIISATASCGCTMPNYPKQPVQPGKQGTIKVKYLPKGRPGAFVKTVKVRTNDPRNKKVTLKISGTVTPAK